MPRLRPVLLRRRRRGWLAATTVHRRPRRSWLRPIATGGIPYRGRLGMAIALTPSLTFARTTSMLARVTHIKNRVTTVALPPRAAPVVASVSAPGRQAELRGAIVEARHAAASRTAVERVRTRLRVERLRVERHLRTETAAAPQAVPPPGLRGMPRPPGQALTVVRAAPALAAATTPVVPDGVAIPAELALAPPPAPRVEPPDFTPPDVDALATQVLDRIEHRAVAQRERMGRI